MPDYEKEFRDAMERLNNAEKRISAIERKLGPDGAGGALKMMFHEGSGQRNGLSDVTLQVEALIDSLSGLFAAQFPNLRRVYDETYNLKRNAAAKKDDAEDQAIVRVIEKILG